MLFCAAKKLTVLQSGPAELVGRCNRVSGQQLPERNGGSLIEEDTHLGSQESRAGCVLQDMTNLRERNPGKPLKELVNRGILFKILKQSGNRNSRAAEYPGTTDAIRVALNVRARGPVNHGPMVAL